MYESPKFSHNRCHYGHSTSVYLIIGLIPKRKRAWALNSNGSVKKTFQIIFTTKPQQLGHFDRRNNNKTHTSVSDKTNRVNE